MFKLGHKGLIERLLYYMNRECLIMLLLWHATTLLCCSNAIMFRSNVKHIKKLCLGQQSDNFKVGQGLRWFFLHIILGAKFGQ